MCLSVGGIFSFLPSRCELRLRWVLSWSCSVCLSVRGIVLFLPSRCWLRLKWVFRNIESCMKLLSVHAREKR